jgi:hypothetical protein
MNDNKSLGGSIISPKRGCYFCFKTLNQNDPRVEYREFVQCTNCHFNYHTVCIQNFERCLNCGSGYWERDIDIPPIILRSNSCRPIPIVPAKVIYLSNEQQPWNLPQIAKRIIISLFEFLRAIGVAILFIFIAVIFGSYSNRFIKLHPMTLDALLNAVFKQNLPSSESILAALISGVVFALVIYRIWSNNKAVDSDKRPNPITVLVAGVVSILLADILILNMNPLLVFRSNLVSFPYRDIVIVQGVTLLVLLLLLPLQHSLAPIHTNLLLEAHWPAWLSNIYGWLRLIMASIAIILIIAYASMSLSPNTFHLQVSELQLPDIVGNFSINSTFAGALLTGCIIASIAFWPPRFRQVKGTMGLFRFGFLLLCGLCIGVVYHNLPQTYFFTFTIKFTVIAMILTIPLQRSLS